MPTPPDHLVRNRYRLSAIGILTVSALLFGVRLDDRDVVSEEMRFAEVAREMALTGDHFHPTLNGKSYYDKPLGSYWLIVAASQLTGGVDETAARLPAAVAGWLGILCVMLLGWRLYDARTALWSGAILATCFSFAFYARRATADIETVTGTLAAVTLFAYCRERKSGAWVVGLWLIMGLTSLTKGLLGFALPFAVLGAYGFWTALTEPRTETSKASHFVAQNRWFFNRWTPWAVALGLAAFLLPFLLSGSHSGLEEGLGLVYRENVQRFFQPHNHTGPVYLYIPVLFVLAAPWGLFLPASLWPRRDATDSDRLAKSYFWAIFVVFTLSASRRSYYLLPVLPAAALLVARMVNTPVESLRPAARRLVNAAYALVALGVAGAGILLIPPSEILPPPHDRLPLLPARSWFASGWLAAIALVAWAFRHPTRRAFATLAVAVAGLGFGLLVAYPALGDYRTRKGFVTEVDRVIAAEPGKLALYRARDVVFRLARPEPLPDFEDSEAFHTAAATGQIRWVIVRRRYLPQLAKTATEVILDEVSYPWEGVDQLGDKMLLLKIVPAECP